MINFSDRQLYFDSCTLINGMSEQAEGDIKS